MKKSPGSRLRKALSGLAQAERAALEGDARYRPLTADEARRLDLLRMEAGELPYASDANAQEQAGESSGPAAALKHSSGDGSGRGEGVES
jgi:hypothetical protein